MKAVFYEIKPWEAEHIKKILKGHALVFRKEALDSSNIVKDAQIVSPFIYSKIDKKALAAMPKLKAVVTRSTGYDHIDIAACKMKKVIVSNVPSYGENTVAEHTFALMLSISRNLAKSNKRVCKTEQCEDDIMGFDLKGKTIGIIGGGRIGMHVARIAHAFAMKVLVFDLERNQFMSEVLGFEYTDMDRLLKSSDIVTLHVPYNKHTHHLIGKPELRRMKKGAVLINTSRGAIVDTDAMLKALESRRLAGAGLDVIEGEDLLVNEDELLTHPEKQYEVFRAHRIFSMDNVVFTPHNAFNSKEAIMRILDTTVENILAVAKGKPVNSCY